jgi:hypothetical protein
VLLILSLVLQSLVDFARLGSLARASGWAPDFLASRHALVSLFIRDWPMAGGGGTL